MPTAAGHWHRTLLQCQPCPVLWGWSMEAAGGQAESCSPPTHSTAAPASPLQHCWLLPSHLDFQMGSRALLSFPLTKSFTWLPDIIVTSANTTTHQPASAWLLQDSWSVCVRCQWATDVAAHALLPCHTSQGSQQQSVTAAAVTQGQLHLPMLP